MGIDWVSRSRGLTLGVRDFIDGRWYEICGEAREKLSPRDGSVLFRFGAGEPRSVDDAVASARRAVEDGRWSKQPVQRRKEVLHRLASLIESHIEELALIECLDVGKPIHDV